MKIYIDFSIAESPIRAYGNATGFIEVPFAPAIGDEISLFGDKIFDPIPNFSGQLRVTSIIPVEGGIASETYRLDDVVMNSHAEAKNLAICWRQSLACFVLLIGMKIKARYPRLNQGFSQIVDRHSARLPKQKCSKPRANAGLLLSNIPRNQNSRHSSEGRNPVLRFVKTYGGLGPSLSMETPFGALGRQHFLTFSASYFLTCANTVLVQARRSMSVRRNCRLNRNWQESDN